MDRTGWIIVGNAALALGSLVLLGAGAVAVILYLGLTN